MCGLVIIIIPVSMRTHVFMPFEIKVIKTWHLGNLSLVEIFKKKNSNFCIKLNLSFSLYDLMIKIIVLYLMVRNLDL